MLCWHRPHWHDLGPSLGKHHRMRSTLQGYTSRMTVCKSLAEWVGLAELPSCRGLQRNFRAPLGHCLQMMRPT